MTNSERQRAASLIAGITCVALGMSAVLGGHIASGLGFAFFVLTLPWTLSIYLLTMFFGLTSPIAIMITLAGTTAVAWRYLRRVLIRACVSAEATS
jgi:hypothetical protein